MNAQLERIDIPGRRLCVFRIVDAMLNGASLREAVKAESISLSTFQDYLQSDKEAAVRYARAQEIRGDVLADEIIHIADNEEDAAKARNQITARQWLSGKLNKRYGDRVDLNVVQTIDVSSVLLEARARAALPVLYQQPVEDVQALDSHMETGSRALDNQSIALDVPGPDDVPDIFS